MNDFASQVASLSSDRRELLQRLLRHERVEPTSGVLPRSRDQDAPLSFAQEQLWFIDQLGPGNPSYNIAASVRFTGALDPVALDQALHALVRRHEVLRTTIVARAGQLAQVIAPHLPLIVQLVDLR